jgi:hypothetical protein
VSRSQRGVALPSPVIMLTVVAVLVAAVAFFATRNHHSDEVALTNNTPTSSPGASPTTTPTKPPVHHKPKPPAIDKAKVKVVVYNNTNIAGLAGTVGDTVKKAGWDFTGADNWQGTIPSNTVYYGAHLRRAAKQLGLDLGIKRVVPRDPQATGMLADGLTVILVGQPS